MNLAKSVLHNLGVTAVSFLVAGLGLAFDQALHLPHWPGLAFQLSGAILLAAGFGLRAWAAWHFYQRKMAVIVLEAQSDLVTDGPFRFSRNPLYLGGNLFMFLGAALILGSPAGVAITLLGLIPTNVMIRREEQQLEAHFGEAWRAYASRVRRWV